MELGSWKSSDPSVIGESTGGYGTADLLAVTRPAFGEDDQTVTLSANMTSLRYRNAKNADGTAAVPDMTAELTVTVPAYTNVLASLSVAGADVPFDPQNAFSVTVPADTKEVKVTAVAKDPRRP